MTRSASPAPRQAQVLRFIAYYVDQHGYPPTRREICDALGATTTSAAADHLRCLARKGLVTVAPHISRGIRLTDAGHAFIHEQAGGTPRADGGA